MTESVARTPVTSLTDLVELVPTLLGFHPSDSIVLLAIDGGCLVFTARTDLAAEPGAALAAAWRRLPGAQMIVIAFSPDPVRAWAALDDVDLSMPDGTDRLFVHADGECWFECPDDLGTPYDALGSVHLAQAAFDGQPVRRSRQELYRLVEPQRTPAEVTASLERIAEREGTLSDVVGSALALVAGHDAEPGELDIDDATVLCLASHDATFLDDALVSTTKANAATRRDLWLQVVGSSVPNCTGGALVAAALAAWLNGDGGLLSVCLEVAQDRPAPAVWVGFLDAVHREALPPSEWESVRSSLAPGMVSTIPA